MENKPSHKLPHSTVSSIFRPGPHPHIANRDAGRVLKWYWELDSWSADSYGYDSPASFSVYSDGYYALFFTRVYNMFDGYGFAEPHWSVLLTWHVQYKNANGGVISQIDLDFGDEGYKAATPNKLVSGIDDNFLRNRDQIVAAEASITSHPHY